MSYSVRIKHSASRDLARIPQPARGRLVQAIDGLGKRPTAGRILKGGLRGLRRLRVGAYRIVYELLDDQLVVLVVRVSHRHRAYRPI